MPLSELFSNYILRHEGKRFCVMGGSPSMRADLDEIRADIYISANEHGIKYRSCDYIVSMDEKHGGGGNMVDVLREFSSAPIISPCKYGDIKPHSWPQAPRRIYSGLIAAWIAWAMGAKVVYLAGFDAYGQAAGATRKAKLYVDAIPCPVREIGGRMGVWPQYTKGERFRFVRHAQYDALIGTDGMVMVQARKPTQVAGVDLVKGDKIFAARADVQSLIKHGILMEVET